MNTDTTTPTGEEVTADRDAIYDRIAAVICYEKHHQREGEFCPNCRSRAGVVHGPIVMREVRRLVTEAEAAVLREAADQDAAKAGAVHRRLLLRACRIEEEAPR